LPSNRGLLHRATGITGTGSNGKDRVTNAVSRLRGAMRPNDAETFAPENEAQGDPKRDAGKCRVPVAPTARVQRVESTR
jgi:hypothetical protein